MPQLRHLVKLSKFTALDSKCINHPHTSSESDSWCIGAEWKSTEWLPQCCPLNRNYSRSEQVIGVVPVELCKPASKLSHRPPDAPWRCSYSAAIRLAPAPCFHAPPRQNPLHSRASVTSANSLPSTIATASQTLPQLKNTITDHFLPFPYPINAYTVSETYPPTKSRFQSKIPARYLIQAFNGKK